MDISALPYCIAFHKLNSIMFSIYLNYSTCIYFFSLDKGVPMTSKHREKSQMFFVSSATRCACAEILGSLATHTPVLKSSRLSPLSWFLHLEQAAVIIIFIEIITLIWLFGLVFANSCRYPFFSLSGSFQIPNNKNNRKTCQL